jgi:hypothetical protein
MDFFLSICVVFSSASPRFSLDFGVVGFKFSNLCYF